MTSEEWEPGPAGDTPAAPASGGDPSAPGEPAVDAPRSSDVRPAPDEAHSAPGDPATTESATTESETTESATSAYTPAITAPYFRDQFPHPPAEPEATPANAEDASGVGSADTPPRTDDAGDTAGPTESVDGEPTDVDDFAPPVGVPQKRQKRPFFGLASSYGAPVQMTTIQRLRDFHPTDRLNGWLVTIGISVLAFVIRVWNVGYPNKLVFDETYYPKDAWAILKYGYEVNWPDNANDSIVAGNPNVMSSSAEFAVHPPLGKLIIGVGEHFFGMNSFGWRIMSVVFGTILVFATIRLARRLSRSTLIGGIAGLLLTLDGLAFVMSRIALLDIFQAAFLVIAVSCAVADRDWFRMKLANHLERTGRRDLGGEFGPMVLWRPWRLATGLAFGAACAVKWNSMYALAAFGILAVLWDVGARRLAGARMKSWWALLADGVPGFVYMVVVAFFTYLAAWIPWLVTSGGWDRDWGRQNPDSPLVKMFGDGFASLIRLHQDIYAFHTGDYINSATHPYSANPALWLIMGRPTGVDAVNNIPAGTDGCTGPDTCVRVISAAGTPILWWMAAAALVVCVIWWLAARDWRFGVPVIAAMSMYLPWFMYTSRPLFFFYAVTIIPFTCIGLALVMGLILGDRHPKERRRTGAIIVGVAVALVALNFAYIYPILTDQILPYSSWLARMWFGSWV